MWINILPPFLRMINLRNNTIPGNHWVVMDIIAYCGIGPVLSSTKHISLILDGVKTVMLRTITVDLHDAPSKLCKVISNSDIKSPAHQFQHVSLYHYHHRAATHCRRRAPWSTPICGPSQGKLVELNNAMHHPTTTSLQQHPCAPATTSTRTTNWRVEGV